MFVDTTQDGNYGGLGDMVSLAWVAEGAKRAGGQVAFVANGTRRDVLSLLGQEVVPPQPTATKIVGAYQKELAERGRRPRVDYMREALGITAAPARPPHEHPASSQEWAASLSKRHAPHVLLFPQAEWQPRTWPPAYWVDLAWMLNEGGVSAAVMLAARDERFFNVPLYYYGCGLRDVAALLSSVELVVGNDSGPAHLAGTLGTPTLALMGPTRAACVFGHIREVTPLAVSGEPGCAGCHFSHPYRAACDQGCQALHLLTPATVFRAACKLLA